MKESNTGKKTAITAKKDYISDNNRETMEKLKKTKTDQIAQITTLEAKEQLLNEIIKKMTI